MTAQEVPMIEGKIGHVLIKVNRNALYLFKDIRKLGEQMAVERAFREANEKYGADVRARTADNVEVLVSRAPIGDKYVRGAVFTEQLGNGKFHQIPMDLHPYTTLARCLMEIAETLRDYFPKEAASR